MGVVDVSLARPHVTLPPGSRLGLPGAIIFVIGVAMMYVAFRGWDAKYGIVGGRLAGGAPRPDAPVAPEPVTPQPFNEPGGGTA